MLEITKKQEYSIKFALRVLEENAGKYLNVVYSNRKTGLMVGVVEAINTLEDMVDKFEEVQSKHIDR